MSTGRKQVGGLHAGAWRLVATAAALAGVAVACDSNPTAVDHSTEPVAAIAIAPSQLAMQVGDVVPLQATATCQHGVTVDVTLNWASDAADVATVDATGTVTAVAFGAASVTAEADGVIAEVPVSVAAQGTVVGVEGGTVTADGLALVIPAGALDEPTDVIVTALDDATYTEDPLYVDGTAYEIKPAGLALNSGKPATLSISYDPANVATDMPQERLRIHVRNQAQSSWEGTSDGQINTAEQIATSQISQFGTYGVVGRETTVPVVSVSVTPATLEVGPGLTGNFTAQALDDEGLPLERTFTWASNDAAVATVDPSGVVTGVAEGNATITASAEGINGTAQVTVAIPVATVAVAPTSFTIAQGETRQLTAEARDANQNVLARSFQWQSSNPAAATVNGAGLVTGVAAGSATITATAGGKSATASAEVTVPVASITVTPATLSVVEDDTVQLTAVALDGQGNAIPADFTWTSSDPAVATVSSGGKLVALTEGTVTITASAGGKQGGSNVTVGRRVASLAVTPTSITLMQGQTAQLTGQALDKQGNPMSDPVGWTSGNSAVASVSASGLVTGVAPGATTVSASAGKITTPVPVNVTKLVASVTITGTSGSKPLAVGATLQLTATAYDIDGAVVPATITWSSSDENIGTVSNTGLVTGVASGTVTISARAGTASDAVDIKVSGGETTTTGNNISWPLVFAEGTGLTGSPVATDPGVRPLTTETDALAELAGIPVTNPTAEFFYSGNAVDGTGYYLQGTPNTWRAQIIDGTGQSKYAASAGWGDNLVSQSITVGKKVRVEIALSATGVGTLTGYNMPYVQNASSPDEIQGTDGTTNLFVPLIYTVGPTFTVELNGSQVSSEVMTPEVNVGGRLVYGGQWIPATAGSYTLRFRLASGANVEITDVDLNGYVVNAQETAIDVTVTP